MKGFVFGLGLLVAVLVAVLRPPTAFPDRLASIPESETTIDNSFYNNPVMASAWWNEVDPFSQVKDPANTKADDEGIVSYSTINQYLNLVLFMKSSTIRGPMVFIE